jgi:hypothetical protein
MINALFWYTGLIAWILIVFGVISTLLIEARDRKLAVRGDQMNRR